MFTKKKTELWAQKPKSSSTSGFVAAATQGKSGFLTTGKKKQAETRSGNNSLKYSTTGDDFVDQFGKLGAYKAPRSFSEIEKDCETLWANNKLLAVCFILYVRMITRVVQLFDGTSTTVSQKGAELVHEGIMRMIWLASKAPRTFMKNIGLFISVGSWKDIITMLQYDLVYHGWDNKVLNWQEMGDLILSGLKNEKTSELVKKYLPQIKAESACKTVEAQADTMIAKWICSLLYGSSEGLTGTLKARNYKKYRKLKSSGTAHEWQKLISQKKFKEIDFNAIHGRALNKLVRGKFLNNQGLTAAYEKWVTKDETKVKYTGFVHELFCKLPGALSQIPRHEQETINKQFDTTVQKAKDTPTGTRLIVVRDTSGSMGSKATGTEMRSGDIAKAIALYFSALMEGPFANAWIEFHSKAVMHEWKGNTPLEKWFNDGSSYNGTTNFMDVISLFCRIKAENPGLKESEFPTGIVCISDGNFNPGMLGKTNVDSARLVLQRAGFSAQFCRDFIIALWDIPNGYYHGSPKQNFETFGDVPNVFYMSGYSASIVSFLLSGKATNAAELFAEAMNQEVLGMIAL